MRRPYDGILPTRGQKCSPFTLKSKEIPRLTIQDGLRELSNKNGQKGGEGVEEGVFARRSCSLALLKYCGTYFFLGLPPSASGRLHLDHVRYQLLLLGQ